MSMRDAIDDIDALISDLVEVRQRLTSAALRPEVPAEVLWEAEAALEHLAKRSTFRAARLHRAIESLAS